MHEQAGEIRARVLPIRRSPILKRTPIYVRIKADDAWLETRALIVGKACVGSLVGLERRKTGRPRTDVVRDMRQRVLPERSLCVIGGGDSGCGRASSSRDLPPKIYLIHRRDTLRASKIMADRVFRPAKKSSRSGTPL